MKGALALCVVVGLWLAPLEMFARSSVTESVGGVLPAVQRIETGDLQIGALGELSSTEQVRQELGPSERLELGGRPELDCENC